MLTRSNLVLLGCLSLGPCVAQESTEVHRLDTPDYRIEMAVHYYPPYLGRQLSFRSVANPQELLCYSTDGSSACMEKFVGALAVVKYQFQARRKQALLATTFREVVEVVAQSDGLVGRPPYSREVRLIEGEGSDIQAFGYDESSVPETELAALRTAAGATQWVIYRQQVFLNDDREPFVVVLWKHTLNRIEKVWLSKPAAVNSEDTAGETTGTTKAGALSARALRQ